jgi:hypothetical protein
MCPLLATVYLSFPLKIAGAVFTVAKAREFVQSSTALKTIQEVQKSYCAHDTRHRYGFTSRWKSLTTRSFRLLTDCIGEIVALVYRPEEVRIYVKRK